MISRERFLTGLTYLVVFLLPWQTRWIFAELTLNGQVWEYGKLSLYGTEALLFLVLALRGWPWTLPSAAKTVRWGIVFLGACFIAVALGENTSLGAAAMLHIGAAYVLFVTLLDERLNTKHIVLAFLAGLIIPSVLGWYQVTTGTSPPSSWLGLATHDAQTLGDSVVETATGRVLRAYGTFPHPNIFGGYLAVGVLLLAWLTRQWHTAALRTRLLPLAALLCGTLVIAFSRSGWLAASCGFIALYGLMLWSRKILPHRALPLIAAGGLAVLLTLIAFHSVIFTRFQPSARLEARSIQERTGEWQYLDDIVRINPFSGVGPGNYTPALASVRIGDPVYAYQPIHNVFALLLAEIGLLGIGVVGVFLFSLKELVLPVIRTPNGMFAVSLAAVLFILAMSDHYLWSDWAGLSLSALSFALMIRWGSEEKH